MKKFFLSVIFCFIMGVAVVKADAPLDPSWSSCKTDADCTAGIADCCYSWKAINKNHINDLVKASLNTLCLSCSNLGYQGQPETLCINQQCTMTNKKTTGPTAGEWRSQHGIKYSGGIQIIR